MNKQSPGDKIADMENQSNSIESLFERVRNYVETRIDLLKLKAIDKVSDIVGSIVLGITFFIIILIFVIILSIGIALLLGDLLGKSYYGFFIVAGLYAITGLVFYASRKSRKISISDKIIKAILK